MIYKLVSFKDMRAREYPGVDCISDWDDYGDGLYLWDEQRDEPIRFICVDGGEPEDQTFSRDWAWVPDELNEAYKMGFEEGRQQGCSER